MQIQPMQAVDVSLSFDDEEVKCQLMALTDGEMTLSGADYLEKNQEVSFKSPYFHGLAAIQHIHYHNKQFTYTLTLKDIKFKPGMLINTRL